jgi:hypothetical protein
MYAELVYFEGAHFAHIARYKEHVRLTRAQSRAVEACQRVMAFRRLPQH